MKYQLLELCLDGGNFLRKRPDVRTYVKYILELALTRAYRYAYVSYTALSGEIFTFNYIDIAKCTQTS